MFIKKILLIILVFALFTLALCACGEKTPDVNNDPTNPTVDTSVEPTDTTKPSSSNPDAPLIDHTKVTVKASGNIWDKPYTKTSPNTIAIDKNWADYIMLDDVKIMSSECTDISMLKNYFFDSDYHATIDNVYNTKAFKERIASPGTDWDEFATSDLLILSTTFVGEKYYAVIDEIIYSLSANLYEMDLTKFEQSNDKVHIGNSYEQIIKILGEPSRVIIDNASETTAYITCAYETETVRMLLTLFAKDSTKQNEAILTKVKWEPLPVQLILHSQEHLQQ